MIFDGTHYLTNSIFTIIIAIIIVIVIVIVSIIIIIIIIIIIVNLIFNDFRLFILIIFWNLFFIIMIGHFMLMTIFYPPYPSDRLIFYFQLDRLPRT